jgi:hypothetical protein|tara:strand:+ start:616 stop:879 length:264 start_codon:yes stop_codon:yes gene_type:complete
MSGVKGLSGRKPKSVEIELIEKLKPLEPKAFELLKEGLDSGDFKYLRLYFLYRYGKPKEQQEINITSEQDVPLFNLIFSSNDETNNK